MDPCLSRYEKQKSFSQAALHLATIATRGRDFGTGFEQIAALDGDLIRAAVRAARFGSDLYSAGRVLQPDCRDGGGCDWVSGGAFAIALL